MEVLVYAANFLYLFSYLVRDILHLRMLTIVAACCLVTYFYNQPEPLMTVVGWNLFFVALNAFQLFRIVSSRVGNGSLPKKINSMSLAGARLVARRLLRRSAISPSTAPQ